MDISIVIPLLNEEESLKELVEQLNTVLSKMGKDYESIFIDDGSTDTSFGILEELSKTYSFVKIIQFRRNYGKAAALSAGFSAATGDVIITMDADLQDDPDEIPHLVDKIESGLDLVSGWKFDRKDPISKTLPSKLFNGITSIFTGIKIHDFNCGLKAYRREVTEELAIYGELHRYIPVLAHGKGFSVGEIKVKHHVRKFGESKYGLERYARGMFDLVTVLFMGKYSTKPLHLFGSTGLLVFISGIAIDVYIASLKFRFGDIQNRGPLLMLGVLLTILGIQFVSTGLLGEMIAYNGESQKQNYTVRKKVGLS